MTRVMTRPTSLRPKPSSTVPWMNNFFALVQSVASVNGGYFFARQMVDALALVSWRDSVFPLSTTHIVELDLG